MTNKSNVTEFGSNHSLTLPLALVALGALLMAFGLAARADEDSAPPLPSTCGALQVTNGDSVVFHVYAVGVQIYRWSGTNWVFVAPAAQLYGDPGYHGLVGIHYAGPTWETRSGSKVVGARRADCTPDSSAIPWLKLEAVSSEGPGVLDGVTWIQRVNTAGGKAPATNGTTVGQQASVPYTAEYYFYASSLD